MTSPLATVELDWYWFCEATVNPAFCSAVVATDTVSPATLGTAVVLPDETIKFTELLGATCDPDVGEVDITSPLATVELA